MRNLGGTHSLHYIYYCLVGKHKKQVMNSDDELALALKKNKGIYVMHIPMTTWH